MHTRRILAALTALTLLMSILTVGPVAVLATSGGTTSIIPKAGTGGPQTGDIPSGPAVTDVEFPGAADDEEGEDAYSGELINRTLSDGHGAKGVSAPSTTKAKSSPIFKTGFEGLNHYQQRYSRGGNQFSLEPPDQALCVGNGYIVEAVNDVLNIFNSSGDSVLPDNTAANIVAGFPRDVNNAVDLNSFYGYAPAINRTTLVRGPFVTDPTCIYDAGAQRFFLVVLTLETTPAGAFTTVNHLDLAVSASSNPTGAWNIYRIDVTKDGSAGTTGGPCPCLGDYPHIGADANGIYLTTNAFPWGPGDFNGAQIYALSKAQLVAGAPTVAVVHFDTTGMLAGGLPGFTVWPAHSPGTTSYDLSAGGTEYLMSTDGFNEPSTDLDTWALTNTSSLNTTTPALSLSVTTLTVGPYANPPKQQQPGSGTLATTDTPQGFCINDTSTRTVASNQRGCWRLLFTAEPAHNEVISRPDSSDTRMQQVMYANGKLWGAFGTALTVGGSNRAGIEWVIAKPSVATGSVTGSVLLQGYLGAAGYDFSYPAMGVTSAGRGVIAFTATGNALYPSAAYASVDALAGVGAWSIAGLGGTGAAQDDGFTSYKSQVGSPIRTRWGDYGAAAVDGNNVWIASEYIAAECDYTDWGGPFFTGGTGDNLLGTCGGASHGPGVRTALANWSTRISLLTP